MKKGVFIVVSCFIVGVFLFLTIEFSSNTTGYAVSKSVFSCSDSDGGDYSLIKGIVEYSLWGKYRNYSDTCIANNKSLVEYFCTSRNILGSKQYKCENGCSNGACISLQNP